MRILLGLILLAFLGAVGLFAIQNTQSISVKFASMEATAPVAILAVGAYLLGMVSGWNVVAFLKASIRKVGEAPRGESR